MIIEDTWNRLEAEMPRGPGVSVANMRQAYIAGLYAAAAAVNAEHLHAREISEAAFRLETRI